MTSWYSIVFVQNGTSFFNGYFSVNNSNNLITSFFETINGSTDFNTNILGGLIPYPSADNVFTKNTKSFSYGGVNIRSITIQNFFGLSSPYFNIYDYGIIYDGTSELNEGIGNSTFITQISDPSCFNEGTKILCLNKNLGEEYIPIETLRSGDLVKTFKHGYRKIDLIGKNTLINNPSKFNECMFKMEKSDSNGLIEDLIVTGGHSILVDDLGEQKEENEKLLGTQIIDNKYLLLAAVSSDFSKIETVNVYTYYHFILENNGNDEERYGVWANGVLTETPSKKGFIDCKDKFILL